MAKHRGWTASRFVIDVLSTAPPPARSMELTAADLRARVRTGLPYRSLEALATRLGLTGAEAARVLRIPLRTLARRKADQVLSSDESDRLFRLARVAGLALETFGDEPRAVLWLRTKNRALGGESPLDVLDTDAGARLIEDLLGRIAHGIPG